MKKSQIFFKHIVKFTSQWDALITFNSFKQFTPKILQLSIHVKCRGLLIRLVN